MKYTHFPVIAPEFRKNPMIFLIYLLALTGALIVIVGHYWSGGLTFSDVEHFCQDINIYFNIALYYIFLLAPSGALIVTVVYYILYIDPQAAATF